MATVQLQGQGQGGTSSGNLSGVGLGGVVGGSPSSSSSSNAVFLGGISLRWLLGDGFAGKLGELSSSGSALGLCWRCCCPSRAASVGASTVHDVVSQVVKPMLKASRHGSLTVFEELRATSPELVRDVADWYVSIPLSANAANAFQALEDALLSSLQPDQDVFVFLDILCTNNAPRSKTQNQTPNSKSSSLSSTVLNNNRIIHHLAVELSIRISSIGRFIVVFDNSAAMMKPHQLQNQKRKSHGSGLSKTSGSIFFSRPNQNQGTSLGRLDVESEHLHAESVWLHPEDEGSIPEVFDSRLCLWEIHCASKLLRQRNDFVYHVALNSAAHVQFLAALARSPRGVLTRLEQLVSFGESSSDRNEQQGQELMNLASSYPGGLESVENSIISAFRHWALKTAVVAVNNTNIIEAGLERTGSKEASASAEVNKYEGALHQSSLHQPVIADAEISRLCYAISILFEEEGMNGDAAIFLERAIAEAKAAFGPRNCNTTDALHAYAEFQRRNSRFVEAATHYEEVVSIWMESLSPNSSRIAAGKNNWAYCLKEIGQFGEARILFEDALKIWKSNAQIKKSKRYDDQIMTCLGNLTSLSANLGDFDKAAIYYGDSVQIKTKIWGENDERTAKSKRKLASLFILASNFDVAQAINNEACKIMKKVHGEQSKEYRVFIQEWSRIIETAAPEACSSMKQTPLPELERISEEPTQSSAALVAT